MKASPFRREISMLLVCGIVFCLAMGCTACGGAGTAATMFLRKTEGTVAVADGDGKDVAPAENLGLYSGYTVDTGAESYAWIDLDSVKLAKLDENSAAAITKDGKNLSIDVTSGRMFFNVTEPLADDETMEIRTSSMLVGIRGTCGWVEKDSVALREGKVSVVCKDERATVNAGEMAVLTADGGLEVKTLSAGDIPAFVAQEVQNDGQLRDILAGLPASGMGTAAGEPDGEHGPDDPDELAYEVQGTLELLSEDGGPIEFSGEEIYQDIVVGSWDTTVYVHDTIIYGSVYANRGSVYLDESTVKGDVYIAGGSVGLNPRSTIEGNVWLDGAEVPGGRVSGSFQMDNDSRIGKNLYLTGTAEQAYFHRSTVDGIVDLTGGGVQVEMVESTVNGQYYEWAVVVDEIGEGDLFYKDNDEIMVIVGQTP